MYLQSYGLGSMGVQMGYSSDFIFVHPSWDVTDGSGYLAASVIENITEYMGGHWSKSEVGGVPVFYNDNLSSSFTLIVETNAVLVRIFNPDDTEDIRFSYGLYGDVAGFYVAMPNSQNVIIRMKEMYSGNADATIILSAQRNIYAENQPFNTLLIMAQQTSTGVIENWSKKERVFNLSDPAEVNAIVVPIYRQNYVYNTDSLVRELSTAVYYSAETVYQSDAKMFFAPIDISYKREPESIMLNEVEYLGININPMGGGNNATGFMNYYFLVEE